MVNTSFVVSSNKIAQPKFRTAFANQIKVEQSFNDETKTVQYFKDECDINNIMSKYMRTGVLVDPNSVDYSRTAIYGDFTNSDEFYEAQNQIALAYQSFELLPAELRARFDNDPGKLIDFVDNPDNKSECVKLGLIVEPSANSSVVGTPAAGDLSNIDVSLPTVVPLPDRESTQ